MNDIVIFSQSLNKHIEHLRAIFELFVMRNICLALKKTFLKYSSITLLEQKIDDLELINVFEKLAAIIKLRFLITLNELDTYLDLTS